MLHRLHPRSGAPRSFAARVLVMALGLLAACAAPPEPSPDLLAPTDEQTKLRSLQTRTFDAVDRERAMRGVIETLQDLGFIVERANAPLGLVTASRFVSGGGVRILSLTATVRPEPDGRMAIRVNVISDHETVTEPHVYRNFFATLERSMFLGRQ